MGQNMKENNILNILFLIKIEKNNLFKRKQLAICHDKLLSFDIINHPLVISHYFAILDFGSLNYIYLIIKYIFLFSIK